MKRSSSRPRPGPVACIVYTRAPAPGAVTAALFHHSFTVIERLFTRSFVEVFNELEPEVVLAVIRADEPDDLSVLRFLKAHAHGTPVMALLAAPADSDADCVAALEAGADVAYAATTSATLLGAQAVALVRREEGGAEAARSDGRVLVRDLAIDFGRRTVSRNGRRVDLTRSEFDIMALLYRNAGRVLTPSDIVSGIGQIVASHGQARGMVKVHVSHLRQKLGANEDGEYVVTVRGVGYLFERLDGMSDGEAHGQDEEREELALA